MSDPLSRTMLRPERVIVRETMSCPPSASTPFSSSRGRSDGQALASKSASTTARSWPARMRSRSARSPRARFIASMTMDLPAPVSPVSTLSPSVNSRFSASMSAMFWMLS